MFRKFPGYSSNILSSFYCNLKLLHNINEIKPHVICWWDTIPEEIALSLTSGTRLQSVFIIFACRNQQNGRLWSRKCCKSRRKCRNYPRIQRYQCVSTGKMKGNIFRLVLIPKCLIFMSNCVEIARFREKIRHTCLSSLMARRLIPYHGGLLWTHPQIGPIWLSGGWTPIQQVAIKESLDV